MSADGGPTRSGKPLPQRVDDVGRVVQRKGGLRDVGDPFTVLDLESASVLGRLDEDDGIGRLPHRALDLDVAGMADQRDLETAAGIAPRLCVHLGDERANGIHDLEAALRALLVDLGRDTVRREDDQLAFGNLVLGLDEHRAARLEVAHDMDVVDDLVAHVDRRPVLLEQLLDDVDRAHHSCAEAPGCGDENALLIGHLR